MDANSEKFRNKTYFTALKKRVHLMLLQNPVLNPWSQFCWFDSMFPSQMQTRFLELRQQKPILFIYLCRSYESAIVDFLLNNYIYIFPCFKVTNHEEVISQSLCKEDTKTKVVNYLSKVRNAWILPWLAFRSQSSGRQQIMVTVFKRQWMQWKIWNLGYRGSSWRQQSLSNTTAGWRASKKIIQTKWLVRLVKIQRCVMFV